MKQLSDRILSFTERVETDVLSDAGEANAGKAKARKRVEVAGFEKTLTDQCMYVYRDSIGREMIFSPTSTTSSAPQRTRTYEIDSLHT